MKLLEEVSQRFEGLGYDPYQIEEACVKVGLWVRGFDTTRWSLKGYPADSKGLVIREVGDPRCLLLYRRSQSTGDSITRAALLNDSLSGEVKSLPSKEGRSC